MKLANALSLRSEIQTRIQQLESRLNNNALVQEGEEPAEDPMELLRELKADYTRLEPTNEPTIPQSWRMGPPCLICWPGGTASKASWEFCAAF